MCVCVCVCMHAYAQSCPNLCDPTAGLTVLLTYKAHLPVCFSFIPFMKSVLVTQSFLTLWKPMVSSLSGPSVHGILKTRILEWVAISFSRGSS